MSKVNILWMYDDLLDLYGDWGNLLAVTKGLDAMGIPWEIDHKSLGDQPDFSRYQMIYIGPGKARNLAEAAKDLACQKQAVLDGNWEQPPSVRQKLYWCRRAADTRYWAV